jgi:hypothetical protein
MGKRNDAFLLQDCLNATSSWQQKIVVVLPSSAWLVCEHVLAKVPMALEHQFIVWLPHSHNYCKNQKKNYFLQSCQRLKLIIPDSAELKKIERFLRCRQSLVDCQDSTLVLENIKEHQFSRFAFFAGHRTPV